MPLVYPRGRKTAKELPIRDFPHVDGVVREALEEVEEWDPFKDMEGLKWGKKVYLLNTRVNDPTRRDADPHKFLVLLCLTKGLNMDEVEQWLDYSCLNFTREFYFDKTGLIYIDERRVYYKTPPRSLQWEVPCAYITWEKA